MSEKEKLKRRRLELNLTLEEVGNIVGVAKSTVRKWETGTIENMKRDKISLLAKALQVSPSFIMGLEEKNEKKKEEATISKEQETIDSISGILNKNSNVVLSGIKKGNKIDVIRNGNKFDTYDLEILFKSYEKKAIKKDFSLEDIKELSNLYRIPPELVGISRKQYIKFIGESAMFFNDDKLTDETKNKILLSLQEVFYEVKKENKRKK